MAAMVSGGVSRAKARRRQELVEGRSKCEQIRALIDRQSTYLLRRHIADGPEHNARLRRRRQHRGDCARLCRRPILRELCQTEVENLDAVIPGDEDVLGLEIAMDDASIVGRGESPRELKRKLDGLASGNRTALHPFPKRLAFEELRHDECRTGLGADVVYGEDVRVVQRRSGARLLLESMEAVEIGCHCRRQHLDGHITSEPRIVRTIHLAHPAGAEDRDDLVRTEPVTGL
jgi:hypothetical protein